MTAAGIAFWAGMAIGFIGVNVVMIILVVKAVKKSKEENKK